MRGDFATFLPIGFRHIANLSATDHILFVAALTAAYSPREWKRLAWLVTAFTVGHSVSLALATFGLVTVPAIVVEPAIAATIIATAFVAIHDQRSDGPAPATFGRRYLVAGIFGVIHGLGFSNALRALLGGDEPLALPLLGFNVGLEAGQLLIVASFLALGLLVQRGLGWSRRDWVLVLGGATAGVGFTLLLNRLVGNA